MCCLFGLIDYGNCLSQKQKERIIRVLSRECEARVLTPQELHIFAMEL